MSITLVTKTTRCHPVTSLVRRAVSATGPPTRSASTHLAAGWTAALPHAWQSSGPHAHSITEHDRRRRRTTTDDSVQNNTGPLGGPVINRVQLRLMTCKKMTTFQLVKHSSIFSSMNKFKMVLKLNNRAQVLYTYWTQKSFTNLNTSHDDY